MLQPRIRNGKWHLWILLLYWYQNIWFCPMKLRFAFNFRLLVYGTYVQVENCAFIERTVRTRCDAPAGGHLWHAGVVRKISLRILIGKTQNPLTGRPESKVSRIINFENRQKTMVRVWRIEVDRARNIGTLLVHNSSEELYLVIMLSIRCIIVSIITIYELQSGSAFFIPNSVCPRHHMPVRNPVGFTRTTTTPKPASSNARSSRLAPAKTVVEGANQSVLSKAWAVLAPLLQSVRTAAAPAVAIAMANEWPINLAKHILTMISIKFVISTIIDMKRETRFRWSQVPRYLSVVGLLVAGCLWVDSIFSVPYYVIGLITHALSLWGVVSIFSFIWSRRPKMASTTTATKEKRMFLP